MRILKKWHLLAATAILVIALLGISSSALFAQGLTAADCGHTLVIGQQYYPSSQGTSIDIYIDNVGPLPGWCADEHVYISVGHSYPVCLYNYFVNPTLPTCIQDKDWHRIAYVINHKHGTWLDIQDAIWWFADGPLPLTPTAQAMVTDAIDNGEYYVPGAGKLNPIICFVDCNVQCIFYEAVPTPPLPEMPTVLLLGLGVSGLGVFGLYGYRKMHSAAP